MTTEEIMSVTAEVFREVLDNDSIQLTRDTTANDIEEWDSLSHVELIVAIERMFKIKFQLEDVKPLKNVGEFIDAIERKTAGMTSGSASHC